MAFQSGTFTYASTIDTSITNLRADWMYDDTTTAANRVLLVLMHGYSEDVTALTATTRQRLSTAGFYTLVIGMRGRNGAAGTRDASGREIHDIYDGVIYARGQHAAQMHPTRNAIVGYSGGGANALNCLAKIPDLFTTYISYFPPANYGTPSTSWYNLNTAIAQPLLDVDVGVPGSFPGRYRARNAVESTPLALVPPGPFLWLFHDEGDVTVDVQVSDAVRNNVLATFTTAERATRFDYRRSTAIDPERYTHGYPDTQPGVLSSETLWTASTLSRASWNMPTSGRVWVLGWIRTLNWSVWLGTGTEHSAIVDYMTTPQGMRFLINLQTTGSVSAEVRAYGESYTQTIASGSSVPLFAGDQLQGSRRQGFLVR